MQANQHVGSPEHKEKGAPSVNCTLPRAPVVLILVGLVGSGKSTFAKALEHHFPRFVRCNQDELVTKKKVEQLVLDSLSRGRSVVIDRTNIDAKQRATWIDLARTFSRVSVWVVTMNTPYEICAVRLRTRTNHPTIKSWGVAQTVLARFASEYEEPSINENFDRMYELDPHPTGEWTKSDITKVLADIQSSPSTRLPDQGSSTLSDLSLYVGLPLAVAAGAISITYHFLSKTRDVQ